MFTDGVSATTKMVTIVDGRHILAISGEFGEVFRNAMVETVPPHRSTEHAIYLEPGNNMPYGMIYNLLEFELRTVKAYNERNTANRLIQ